MDDERFWADAEERQSRIWRGGTTVYRSQDRAPLHSWQPFEMRRLHAITLQWVHVARAHLDLSPPWREVESLAVGLRAVLSTINPASAKNR